LKKQLKRQTQDSTMDKTKCNGVIACDVPENTTENRPIANGEMTASSVKSNNDGDSNDRSSSIDSINQGKHSHICEESTLF
jgi:hypothetical protein